MRSAQDRVKYYIDKNKSFCEFEVGDKVFLKVTLQRFGLKLGKTRKLLSRFYGSFEILKRIEPMVYKLKLLNDWKIHNVFHVSLLRKYVSDASYVLSELPKAAREGELIAKPERISKVDIQHLRNRSFQRLLVK